MGKGNSDNPKKMGQLVFSACNIQTGPLPALSAPFVVTIFKLFQFHIEEPNFFTSDGEMGFLITSEKPGNWFL